MLFSEVAKLDIFINVPTIHIVLSLQRLAFDPPFACVISVDYAKASRITKMLDILVSLRRQNIQIVNWTYAPVQALH